MKEEKKYVGFCPFSQLFKNNVYPLSDHQLENLRAVFGRGVKKRNGRRLAGNPADFVNTLAGEFWLLLLYFESAEDLPCSMLIN